MEIFISVNGVLRNTIQKFDYHYNDYYLESTEENNENKFEYGITEPILNDNILNSYKFQSKEEYEYFTSKTNLNVKYYCPNSLFELSMILNSCQKVIGSLSAVLSIATGLHINCVYGVDITQRPGICYFENIDLPFIKYRIT